MLRARPSIAAAAALTALAAGCASYPHRTEKALGDFQGGQLEQARKAYEDPKTTGSAFLSGAEAGMVALAAGDWDGAIANLSRAAREVEQEERSALVSPESLGETLLSWTLNESGRSYPGEGYERVLVHAGLAIAYLGKGDLEAARVEVRQSNALLESEEELYETEYAAGGLGHFLSAVTYEMDGRADDAWIDYRRMREKGVGNELACRALARLAGEMRREEELDPEERAFVDGDGPGDAASIVVIAGIGLGPFKGEIALPIPTESGLLQWSVPSFHERPQPVDGVELSIAGGDRSVRTVVVEDVATIAKENLEDRIAWLAAKSAVRAVIKRELTQHLQKEAGILGRIAGDVFTLVTERADLRAWQTLPDSWQAARVFVAPGAHEIRVSAVGGAGCALGTFELERGETMFVIARTVGARLYAHPVGGRRCEPGAKASEPAEGSVVP